jgi:hypothetical protein
MLSIHVTIIGQGGCVGNSTIASITPDEAQSLRARIVFRLTEPGRHRGLRIVAATLKPFGQFFRGYVVD